MITLDFETYSEAGYTFDWAAGKWRALGSQGGIKEVGGWIYSRHPSTEILTVSYIIPAHLVAAHFPPRLQFYDRGGMLQNLYRWKPGDPYPQPLFDAIARGELVEAHNAFFEFSIYTNVCVARLGWPIVPLENFRCTAARAAAWALPRKLEQVAKALGTHPKNPEGKNVISQLSRPQVLTKNRRDWRFRRAEYPDKFATLDNYCDDDALAEHDAGGVIPELSPVELELWLIDQRINARGVHIDRELLEACAAVVEQALHHYTAELQVLTGGYVQTANQTEKMREWAAAWGVHMGSVDADHIEEALARADLPASVRRLFELRQMLAASSIKKLYKMRHRADTDGRIRDAMRYCGAERTGRWSGQGPQPHNLPASGPGADAIPAVMTRSLAVVEHAHGNALDCVGSVLRSVFCAAPGCELIASDYKAIEAVVLAVLAGEQWRIDVFNTHGLIYETSASKLTGVPFEEFLAHKERTKSAKNPDGEHHPLRKKIGKFAELASGYQGALGAWKKFGADEYLTDEEIKAKVKAWRKASPMIVKFWYGLQDAAVAATANPGQCYAYREIQYMVAGGVLYCRLPSGRCLSYHTPELQQGKYGPMLTFMGIDSTTKQWVRQDTYGGKLVENTVQAVARDLLAHAIVNLEKAGYPIVLHVHDEAVAEVVQGWGSIEQFEHIMADTPTWAAGWPVKAAGGWRGLRFRKD